MRAAYGDAPGGFMFDSLEERIKRDEDLVSTRKERIMRYVLYAVIAVALFGGLFLAIHALS